MTKNKIDSSKFGEVFITKTSSENVINSLSSMAKPFVN